MKQPKAGPRSNLLADRGDDAEKETMRTVPENMHVPWGRGCKEMWFPSHVPNHDKWIRSKCPVKGDFSRKCPATI